ncbi:MAG: hypothetical protein H5U08_13695 [Thermogutta sp.]|uniref:hypothetical protein n=1 Tax=Thermogutta sp. TaxID=1962930 RepID=UPI0019B3146F|nr:hypothetical protein [Thermogutta sp.]MBC7353409.1 hypothetical protein [Thermogutta sp.]
MARFRWTSWINWEAGVVGLVFLIGCSTGSDDSFRVTPKPSGGGQASTAPAPTSPPSASPSPSPTAQQRRPVAMPPGIARPEDVTSDFGAASSPPSPPSSPPGSAVVPPPPTSPQALPAATQGQYVKADVGVGQKGRSLQPGFLTTPVSVYFRSQEHMAFRIQVPHALQLFEAEHGRKPESHEEFWREIIEKNNIQLPRLPPGHRYVYDPQRGELMVEVPAGSPPP